MAWTRNKTFEWHIECDWLTACFISNNSNERANEEANFVIEYDSLSGFELKRWNHFLHFAAW